jgi:hypothetical protein
MQQIVSMYWQAVYIGLLKSHALRWIPIPARLSSTQLEEPRTWRKDLVTSLMEVQIVPAVHTFNLCHSVTILFPFCKAVLSLSADHQLIAELPPDGSSPKGFRRGANIPHAKIEGRDETKLQE